GDRAKSAVCTSAYEEVLPCMIKAHLIIVQGVLHALPPWSGSIIVILLGNLCDIGQHVPGRERHEDVHPYVRHQIGDGRGETPYFHRSEWAVYKTADDGH